MLPAPDGRFFIKMIRISLNKTFLALILLVIVVSFMGRIAYAQEDVTSAPAGINLTLTPTFVNLVTDPGESVDTSIRITNNNNFTEYLQIEIRTFEPSNDGNSPVIRPLGEGDDFGEWVSFSEEEFSVDPNEVKVVDVEINPPADSSLGYYYAFIITRQNSEEVDGNAAVAGGTAVLALLEVRSENAKRELQIEDFKPKKLFYEYLPAELDITVRNNGNIHAVPVGDIFIDSMTTKEVASAPVNSGRGNILPQSTRTYTVNFDDGFAVRTAKTDKDGNVVRDRNGNIEYTTKFDFSKMDKFRIGKYEANVILVYDNGERDVPIQATVSFWIIPWKIIGGALIVLILVLLGLKSAIAPVFRRK